mgnify:CR=1 FL=1
MDYKIRKFNKGDINKLIHIYVEEYKNRDVNINEDILRIRFQSMIERTPDYCFASINENDELIGAILCFFEKHYIRHTLVIDNLIIHKNYRNLGIARLLMQKVIDLSKTNQLKHVMLLADTTQEFPRGCSAG